MALIAWAPKGSIAPVELLVVKLPPGTVTERQWLDALSERVTKLAIEAGPEATGHACHALGLPTTDNPKEAGQFLVEGNWNLQTHLNCAAIDGPLFPATIADGDHDDYAQEAIEQTDLEMWVELALAQVSESSLD
jgi:hypothetical protein